MDYRPVGLIRSSSHICRWCFPLLVVLLNKLSSIMLVVGMLLLTTCFPIPSLDLGLGLGLGVVANLKEGEECLFCFFGVLP